MCSSDLGQTKSPLASCSAAPHSPSEINVVSSLPVSTTMSFLARGEESNNVDDGEFPSKYMTCGGTVLGIVDPFVELPGAQGSARSYEISR